MRTILIAEDNRKTREQVRDDLMEFGFSPIVATTGFEAIRYAKEFRPSVILLDGLLPELHGFEITRVIRAIDRHYSPEIIFMSGIYTNTAYRNEAKLKYGISRFLAKPFTKAQLLTEVIAADRSMAEKRMGTIEGVDLVVAAG